MSETENQAGLISWADFEKVMLCAGTVQRVETRSVALLLNRRGIPLGTILDEQRYIRAHFDDGA